MKMRWLYLGIALLASGCRREAANNAGQPSPQRKPSSATLVIEDLTGKTAVNAGQRARRTIERISAEENKNLQEVLP
jgi:hypothetical protein